VIVAPQISGRLAEVRVKEGDEVKAGQLLALLEPGELQA
jgi:multidrug efflux pump subunit AcrA (membrane-fusion protein)